MPQLMSKDPPIHLVGVAELWSYVYMYYKVNITNDLNPDLWFNVTPGGRRFEKSSIQRASTKDKKQYGDTER